MGVVDFAAYVKGLIQAGEVVEGSVVKVVADNGAEIGDAVFKVVQGGNGAAQEVGVAVTEGAGGATTATGLAFLTMDVGVAGAAIAPALGVLAGVGLYNLAPEFWTNVSNALVNAGQTIGGKVIAYWNGDNVNLSEETIEIFKNELYAEGIFDISEGYTPTPEQEPHLTNLWRFNSAIRARALPANTVSTQLLLPTTPYQTVNPSLGYGFYVGYRSDMSHSDKIYYFGFPSLEYENEYYLMIISDQAYAFNAGRKDGSSGMQSYPAYQTINGKRIYYQLYKNFGGDNTGRLIDCPLVDLLNVTYKGTGTPSDEDLKTLAVNAGYIILYGNEGQIIPDDLQPDATFPDENPFPLTYPNWIPWEYPSTIPDPSALPTVYPLKYPEIGPDGLPTQDPAQNPDPEPVTEIIPEIIDNFQLPNPTPDPQPEPVPTPDPDPQPDPDPIPEPDDPTPAPDPIDPNPDPTPSPIIPITPFPDAISSNKLFTVYNPTTVQLDALGGYLWDGSIIAQIRDIWQEPLDGIISLIQVYATPPTSGAQNIILGFLNTGVSAAVVSNQFTTIDCGSVTVNENKGNATDYAPFTSLHVYLPFIGIVELDTNECMNATINIKYRVDVYTGTCLATIAVTRPEDMPNGPILYNYSGNCSQQIPLTSGNNTGMLSALIGGITAGLSVASGGSLGVVAGASIAGQSLTNDMFHIGHSGNLSANAGILGNKKPYLIIGRRHGYDANNYNALYGFPANKTIYLGNQSGYVKVKSCFLKTSATQPEHDEIMSLLETGVII